MAARGRGRGRGLSFSVDTLGFGRGETLPAAIQQPPPLYPLLLYKPVPLQKGEDYDYLLALKQDFRTTIRRSPFYLTLVEKKQDIERYSDKYQLGQQDVQGNWTPNWQRFPAELREKRVRKHKTLKAATPIARKDRNVKEIVQKVLETLEKAPVEETAEKEQVDTKGEEEKQDEDEEEEEAEEEYDEEELEEETDYNMTYFDNGEGYGGEDEDEDDEGVY
ncbi:hypothetical protein C0Q70_20257 [Pomacea canaliculata]|uniref:DNA-directed RNA polymerase III subunit n=1 Tax=Pomacea canaliculata TaxID=400727 RepID=A0A2T7NF25_POMCA|nr:DNA-directed RNA polymerase III subunit RPC7-like [Pomacea canaliculata]PVD19766.1 hypothetical protein C0Q70_20257 [Pomacea canaliculata]